jgi:hypothetical protein
MASQKVIQEPVSKRAKFKRGILRKLIAPLFFFEERIPDFQILFTYNLKFNELYG